MVERLRFDAHMERCLYGPDGFYAHHGVAGRSQGDFITSPEVGPLFGAVLANVLDHWWEDLGCPDPWTIYDVGCGPNTLLKAIRRARPLDSRPWRLVGVDVAPGPDRLTELPEDLGGAVVIANELLDNMPFRILCHSAESQWSEVHVEIDGDGAREVLLPTEARLDIPPGTRAPMFERAEQWCRSVMDRGRDQGQDQGHGLGPSHLCLFDYGTRSTAELASRGGWLRTYRQHERGADPFYQPSLWDITGDVAADQLPSGASVTTQTEFLAKWGIDDLVNEGRDYWKANAARPDLTAIAMRSRVSEAEALTDPRGLGAWLVIHYDQSNAQR